MTRVGIFGVEICDEPFEIRDLRFSEYASATYCVAKATMTKSDTQRWRASGGHR